MVDPATSSVFATLSLNGTIFVACIILFELVRGQREVYAPRLRSMAHRTPEAPSKRFFSWIGSIYNVSDEETLKTCGADGYIFYRFLLVGWKIFTICALLALIILFPVYGTAPGNEGVAGLNLYSMGNLEDGGVRLWASCVMSYLFTAIFLYFMHKEYENFVRIRRQFLKEGDVDTSEQKNFSVLVENVPIEYRSSEKLFEFFNDIFTDEVMYACISVKTGPLTKAAENRKSVVVKLEQATATWKADKEGKKPEIKLKKGKLAMCGTTEKSDAITHWTNELKDLDVEVTRLREMAIAAENANVLKEEPPMGEEDQQVVALNDEKANKNSTDSIRKFLAFENIPQITKKDVCGTGFVTFKSRKTQICACQLPVLSEEYPDVIVVPAPAPNDVVWKNIATKVAYTNSTNSIVQVVYYLGLLFWGLILAFIAAVSTLANLEKFLPFVKQLDSVTYAIVAGQLPVIMVIVLIALLPIVMKAVSTFIEKRKSHSSISQEVFSWYFIYQLANVYLLLLAGSIFGALADALKRPQSIFFLLGEAVPGVSIFFLNYIITVGFTGIPVLLLRVPALVVYKLFRTIKGEKKLTRRSLAEGPLAPFPLDYGIYLPPVIYVMAIILTYWTISPIVLVAGAFYFGGMLLAWKYLLLYVIVPEFESGGTFFFGIHKFSMICLMASTITGIGFMAIKQGVAQTPVMVPLPFLILYCWNYTEKKYLRLSMNLPFSIAVNDDKNVDEKRMKEIHDQFSPDYLRQPEFLLPNKAVPYPHRINNIPLMSVEGHVNEVYWADAVPESPRGSPRPGGTAEDIENHRVEKDAPPAPVVMMLKAAPLENMSTPPATSTTISGASADSTAARNV